MFLKVCSNKMHSPRVMLFWFWDIHTHPDYYIGDLGKGRPLFPCCTGQYTGISALLRPDNTPASPLRYGRTIHRHLRFATTGQYTGISALLRPSPFRSHTASERTANSAPPIPPISRNWGESVAGGHYFRYRINPCQIIFGLTIKPNIKQ